MYVQNIDILSEYYDDVDDIDLFIGGILEPSSEDSLLGETFKCIVGEQFMRLKVRLSRCSVLYVYPEVVIIEMKLVKLQNSLFCISEKHIISTFN